jgi:O-antigen/teichoic acid export membrane protein
VIPPVACAVFFQFLYPLFSTIEFYYEKTHYILASSCLSAVLNIVLNYIFIPKYGYIIAGYTTLVCYIFFAFLHYLFQKKIFSEYVEAERNVFDSKIILLISGGLLLAMGLITLLYRHRMIRYIICAVIIFILFLCKNIIINYYKSLKSR